MNRLDVRVLTDPAGKRRVVIYRHCSGSYRFEEQRFLDAPDFRWISAGQPIQALLHTEEQAIAAARSQCGWLTTP